MTSDGDRSVSYIHDFEFVGNVPDFAHPSTIPALFLVLIQYTRPVCNYLNEFPT